MTNIITEDPYELAALKAKGASLDILEQRHLPDTSKPLFIVNGFTGEHKLGTFQTWLIRAFRNKMRAESYAEACSKHAQLWERTRTSYTQSPPFGWSLLDPKMRMSYHGTRYNIQDVSIELRPEDIFAPEEICPICGAHTEYTPLGKICDNGHEL